MSKSSEYVWVYSMEHKGLILCEKNYEVSALRPELSRTRGYVLMPGAI